jgi:hypothetical protein
MHRDRVLRARRPLLVALFGLLTAVTLGCSENPPPSATPPPFAEVMAAVMGPLRPDPVAVPDELAVQANAACQRDSSLLTLPPDLRLSGVDARGAGRVTLIYQGARAYALCDVTIRDAATLVVSGTTTGSDRAALSGPFDLQVWGGSTAQEAGKPREQSVIGATGAGIASVDVLLADGSTVRATVRAGIFTVWWRTLNGTSARGYDANGTKVAEEPIAP